MYTLQTVTSAIDGDLLRAVCALRDEKQQVSGIVSPAAKHTKIL